MGEPRCRDCGRHHSTGFDGFACDYARWGEPETRRFYRESLCLSDAQIDDMLDQIGGEAPAT